MIHNRYILWPALALLAIVMACTNDDIITPGTPPLSTDDNVYTYKLRLNMAYPGSTTRGEINRDPEWPDGSTMQFRFTKDISKDIKVSGIATYNKGEGEWTATAGQLPIDNRLSCSARYLRPDADDKTTAFLTPTYSGNSLYSCSIENENDSVITIDTLTLHPATWRMRFKGEKESVLNFSSNDIQDDLGNKLTTAMPLTVADDGYTPYIYALFANSDSENTITTEIDGKIYHRTIISSDYVKGRTFEISLPNGENKNGWEPDEEQEKPNLSASIKEWGSNYYTNYITFRPPYNFGTLRIESNVSWTINTDNEWIELYKNGEGHKNEIHGENDGYVDVNVKYKEVDCDGIITIENEENDLKVEISVHQEVPRLEVSPETLTFGAVENLSQDVTIRDKWMLASYRWSINNHLDSSWWQSNYYSHDMPSKYGETITITANENWDDKSREDSIVVKCYGVTRTIKVYQKAGVQASTSISLKELTQKVAYQGRDIIFNVTSNETWTATRDDDDKTWCIISPESGGKKNDEPSDTEEKITIKPNDTYSTRTVKVTIKGEESENTNIITIEQDPKPKSDIDITPFGEDDDWDNK